MSNENTSDFITLNIISDTTHIEKYVIKAVEVNNVKGISYKTLDKIIQDFKLRKGKY